MSRFLFVVPPLAGHINPAVGVAGALTARGHEVAWAGHEELLRRLAGPDARIFPCAVPRDSAARTADLKGPAALQFLWEEFLVPLAEAMAPGVHAAIDTFSPDVVVADQQTVAGGLIADSLGLTWATSATTSTELLDPLGSMPKVTAWLDALLTGLRGRVAGGLGTANPQLSPHGVLAFTTRELLGPVELPATVRLVGPSLAARPSTVEFPWRWLDPGMPTVLVTLGTANLDAGATFLTAAAEALSGMADRVRAVIVDPGAVLGDVGENVLVRKHVPQLMLLPQIAAVICHAGHNTVCETLWHGVPLVVAPIRDDQPIVAGQVVDAGAGVRLRFNRVNAQRISAAVDTVLTDPGYREAAGRIAASFRAAGGTTAAAEHLEDLALRSGAHRAVDTGSSRRVRDLARHHLPASRAVDPARRYFQDYLQY